MSVTPDGWFSWAIRDPGPLSKTNGGVNTVRGFVPHSAEGYWPHLGVLLHSPERRASWGASNLKDGRLYQHYPIFAQTWTSGAGYPNNNFFSNETEGVEGQPLTDKQVANIVRQITDLSELKGWLPRRPESPNDRVATLYEHRECVRWGAAPTECPSGRIPWDRIMEELMGVSLGEFQALFRFTLEQAQVTQALGGGLAAVAKTVGAQGAEIDELQAAIVANEARLADVRKVLEA